MINWSKLFNSVEFYALSHSFYPRTDLSSVTDFHSSDNIDLSSTAGFIF